MAELDAALVSCILGQPNGCTEFFNRLSGRCLDKVNAIVRKESSSITEDQVETYTQEALGDMTLLASQGKLAVEESYTRYLAECVLNKIRDQARLKKGHEVPLSTIDPPSRKGRNHTTVLFINTLIAPGKRPEESAIQRELVRRIAEQVGGLPVGMRDVVARVRAGMGYDEIAHELRRGYSTVKAQFSQGMDALQQAIGNSGILAAPRIPRHLMQDLGPVDSLDAIEAFFQRLPANIGAALDNVHLQLSTVRNACEVLNEPLVTAEALLLQGYWLFRMATGLEFPKDVLVHLPPHPDYDLHQVRFVYW